VPSRSWSTSYINIDKTIAFSTSVTAADPPSERGVAVMLANGTPLILGDMIGLYSPGAGASLDVVQVVSPTGQMITIEVLGDAELVAATIARLEPEEASDVFARLQTID
jgi:hypothetical protein